MVWKVSREQQTDVAHLLEDASKLRLELCDLPQTLDEEFGHGQEAEGVASRGSVKHNYRKLQLLHQPNTTEAHMVKHHYLSLSPPSLFTNLTQQKHTCTQNNLLFYIYVCMNIAVN